MNNYENEGGRPLETKWDFTELEKALNAVAVAEDDLRTAETVLDQANQNAREASSKLAAAEGYLSRALSNLRDQGKPVNRDIINFEENPGAI